MKKTLCATGLAHAEGPTVLPNGNVVFCHCYYGSLGVWEPGAKDIAEFAKVGGGPNGTVLGVDEHVYVANNGGAVGPFRSEDFGPGSIQKVAFDGTVMTIAREIAGITLNMPNDLVFGRDKRLYFTDPGRWDDANRPDPGRLFVLNADGSGELFAEVGNTYPNGIVAEADGSIVWVETYTQKVRRRAPDGTMSDICRLPSNGYPDGLAVAENGDLYIATLSSGGMHIVKPDGSSIQYLDLDGTVLSNCVFEGSTMFVTDMGGPAGVTEDAVAIGKLWQLDMPVAGMPMFRGAISAR